MRRGGFALKKREVASNLPTSSAGIAFNHALSASIEKIYGGTQTLSVTLKSTGGKVARYAFAAIAWAHTIISAFSNDPEMLLLLITACFIKAKLFS